MSAIHGIASYFVPGLGQFINGDKKEGSKYLGKHIGYTAGATVASTAGALGYMGINTLASADAAKISSKVVKGIKGAIDKNPKAAGVAAAACLITGSLTALGLGVATFANHIKSIVSAAKLNKVEADTKTE